ncbi:hypothetical protein BDZ45DRAFT_804840 [Acephala macrosclerotiorum]|nr:hypothetical protein BDZ45DRAFT_804840 [Acephala macrosclerotiorum]
MEPMSEVKSGTLSHTQDRLCIEPLSLWLIEGRLALVSVASVLQALYPYHRMPRRLGSIGAVAPLIARSLALLVLLRGTGCLSLASLKTKLQMCNFKSWPVTNTSTFRIDVAQHGLDPQDALDFLGHEIALLDGLWHPAAVTLSSRSAKVVGPLSYTKKQVCQIFLALFARRGHVCSWNTLSFTRIVLKNNAPDQKLARDNAHKQILMEGHFGRVALHEFGRAISGRHVTIAATLTLLIVPLLTVVVSGLYTAQSLPAIAQILDIQTDFWAGATTLQNETGYRYDFSVSQQMLDSLPSSKTSNSTHVSIGLRAARGRMNCTLVEYVNNNNLTTNSNGSGYWFVTIPVNEVVGCASQLPNSTRASSGSLNISELSGPDIDTGFFGLELDL